jgi:uncharacterized RDD family membrane protein YckC
MIEVLFALLLAQPAPAPSPTPTAPTPAPEANPGSAVEAPIGLTVTLTSRPTDGSAPVALASTTDRLARPAELRLAEPLTLELAITSEVGTEVFPPLLPALGGFEIIAPDKGLERVEANTGKTIIRRWQVLPVRVGVEKLSPIEVPYRTLGGVESSSTTAPLRVYIRGHLENDNDPALGAPPPLTDVITTNWVLVWVLSISGTLIFAGLVGFVVVLALRQRFEAVKPKPPPRPANEVALERLARLDATPDHELDGGSRVAQTIDTLREYLGRRYDIDALEMTTNELSSALRDNIDLRGASPDHITTMLESADLVKFARLNPLPEEARAPAAVVRGLVEQTWVEVKPVTEEVVRAEPASLRQRFYAGAVDLMLASLLGLLGVLGLFMAGLPELGWIPLGAMGLILFVRDGLGLSAGKRLLRLKVVKRDATQSRVPRDRLFLRNTLLILWPLALPIEWLVLRGHPLSLRLGDMWAETEVVRDRGAQEVRA